MWSSITCRESKTSNWYSSLILKFYWLNFGCCCKGTSIRLYPRQVVFYERYCILHFANKQIEMFRMKTNDLRMLYESCIEFILLTTVQWKEVKWMLRSWSWRGVDTILIHSSAWQGVRWCKMILTYGSDTINQSCNEDLRRFWRSAL